MDEFEANRGMMFAIAYRMLGSVMEAEDMIQEAWLRYQQTPTQEIQSTQAFLRTVITRLCLDQLKSAASKRESYTGPWLPEPIRTEKIPTNDPEAQVTQAESISMAFLILLESLSPVERAVFLLREVFGYEYEEISNIVDKSQPACRQIFRRAKQHISENRPRFPTEPEEHQRILANFMIAVSNGELQALEDILAEDVALYSDGGGKAIAATKPILGQERVAKFLLGITRQAENIEYQVEVASVNGTPAVILWSDHPKLGDTVFNFVMDEGKVRKIYAVRNPDKLHSI